MEVMELCWRSLCVWDLLMVSSFFPLFLCPGLLCLGKPSLSSLRPCYSAVVAPLSIALQKCKSEMCYIQSGSPTICLVLVLGIFLQDAFCHMLDLSFSRRLIVRVWVLQVFVYIPTLNVMRLHITALRAHKSDCSSRLRIPCLKYNTTRMGMECLIQLVFQWLALYFCAAVYLPFCFKSLQEL